MVLLLLFVTFVILDSGFAYFHHYQLPTSIVIGAKAAPRGKGSGGGGNKPVDDMAEALKYLESTRKKPKQAGAGSIVPNGGVRASKTGSLSESDSRAALEAFRDDEQPKPVTKSFAKQTIWGQNIINCRTFSIDAKRTFEFCGSHTDAAAVPTYPLPEIAFLGRSNVGKSSLLNCITGSTKNIAVASKTPGRTRCINQFRCRDAEGDICTFVDLPGTLLLLLLYQESEVYECRVWVCQDGT